LIGDAVEITGLGVGSAGDDRIVHLAFFLFMAAGVCLLYFAVPFCSLQAADFIPLLAVY
jgi:hypothetical protein